MDADVVVVGAGLTGLRCAAVLEDAGLAVRVLEASDTVEGRIRTDRVDDCLCDRGFQTWWLRWVDARDRPSQRQQSIDADSNSRLS